MDIWKDSALDMTKAKPSAIIIDIDGTLLNGKNPIAKTVSRANSYSGTVIIITGRTDRARAVADLRAAGVKYNALYVNSDNKSSKTFKRAVAERLLQRYTITEAIDNDAAARAAYSGLGIKAKAP